MNFIPPSPLESGQIASILVQCYAELIEDDPALWRPELSKWLEYDREARLQPDTVGACLFFTRLEDEVVGLGSWDPRPAPEYAVIGHNCILPEYRGYGFGRMQLEEILRRLDGLKARAVRVKTLDHAFFTPARGMYVLGGFKEINRTPWEASPGSMIIEYEKTLG